MNVYEKLQFVQSGLKVPKAQDNNFGHYKYRSTEDILESAKPLLREVKSAITLSDKIELIGTRYYTVATATFIDVEKGEKIEVTANAREDEILKGMSGAQITGASSSYGRKYALSGLLCIDNTEDIDSPDHSGKNDKNAGKTDRPTPEKEPIKVPMINGNQVKTLGDLMRKNGMTKESANTRMQEILGKPTMMQLTEAEANKLITEFEKVPALAI